MFIAKRLLKLNFSFCDDRNNLNYNAFHKTAFHSFSHNKNDITVLIILFYDIEVTALQSIRNCQNFKRIPITIETF